MDPLSNPLSNPRQALGRDFWLLVAASSLICLVNGAATPLLARYARDYMGASSAVAGIVVGSSSIAAIVLRPWLGRFTDRHGVRRAAIAGAVAILATTSVLLVARSVPVGVAGRALMGVCTALANTALTAWVIELAPPEQSGRALGIFGLSVWVGLALGPQAGQGFLSAGGYTVLWLGCGALGVAASALLWPTATPAVRPSAPEVTRHGGFGLLRAVSVPGIAAALAWSGESIVLAYLTLHLEGHGVRAGGLTGAVSVLSVFALSVVGGRIVLVGLVDRVGPARAACGALLVVAAGLGALAVSRTFLAAAGGAMVLGAGFSPLYPALVLLASRDLAAEQRATGLSLFGGFTDIGVGGGAILGGVLIGLSGTTAAFAVVAGVQVPAAVLIAARRLQRSSSAAGLETSIASTAPAGTPERSSSGTIRRNRWS